MTKPATAVDKRKQTGGGNPPDWAKPPAVTKIQQRKFMWDEKQVLGIAYSYLMFGEHCANWLRASEDERKLALDLLQRAKDEPVVLEDPVIITHVAAA